MSNLSEKVTEKISNTASSYVGSAKQSVGEKLGLPEMAASGATQKAQADEAQRLADERTRTEGWGHKVEGQAQTKIGSLTGDKAMEARGRANETLGDMKQNV